jgi:AcrR family transcriptional regulator
MSPQERRRRADAERNRVRLLEAAEAAFCERGLDVGVKEIAERAGIGRGTLFRNFQTKDDLIAAIVAHRMREAADAGRHLLHDPDPADALFELLAHMVGRQQLDRGLFEAIADTWLAHDEIRAAHAEILDVIGVLLARAQAAGEIREDVGAMDVVMLMKGVCEAAGSFSHVDPAIADRYLDLARAALSATPAVRPLRGRTPTLEDIERAVAAQAKTSSARRAAG